MPYNPDTPPTKNFQSLSWAVWMFRFTSEVKGSDSQFSDKEIETLLELHTGTIEGFEYYRPYETVASWLSTSGQNYKSISIGQTSVTKFDEERIVELRRQQARLDAEALAEYGTPTAVEAATASVRVFWELPR
jgi:hypothetical protein